MNFIKILLVALSLFLLYGYIPSVIIRIFWKADVEIYNNDYLLTFDDGPSELTKEIIKILDDANKKSIFFLLGEKLDSYDLSIYKNHIIACHGYRHINFVYLDPIRTYLEFEKALKTFKKNDIYPKYFRAPYGLYNLVLIYLIKKNNMKIFQWDYLLGDWKVEEEMTIYRRIKEKAHNKNILVLHDATEGKADEHAKTNMLKELKIFLNEETKK